MISKNSLPISEFYTETFEHRGWLVQPKPDILLYNEEKHMIELTPEQQQFVDAQIATGFYKAPEEVVAEALLLLSEYKSREREEVNAAIRASIPDMEAGRGTPLEEVDAKIRVKFGFASKNK